MKSSIPTALLIVFLLGACAHHEGPYVPVTQSPSTEDLYSVVELDPTLVKTVAVDHTNGRKLSDRRLEVAANIRNRTTKDLKIQVQTVFKDEGGYSTQEDSAWGTLFLTANETETYKIVSRERNAAKYTIRIREAR